MRPSLFSAYSLYAELAMTEDPEMLHNTRTLVTILLLGAALVLSLIQTFIFVKQIVLFELMFSKSWDTDTTFDLLPSTQTNVLTMGCLSVKLECPTECSCPGLTFAAPEGGNCCWEQRPLGPNSSNQSSCSSGKEIPHCTWIIIWGCLGGENYKLTQRANSYYLWLRGWS